MLGALPVAPGGTRSRRHLYYRDSSLEDHMRFLVLALAVLLTSATLADDPPRRDPTLNAEPHKAYMAVSKGGLRYAWVLPEKLAKGDQRDLIIICHGTGLDYRWGPANYKPGQFRPRDIVVSVDGPTAAKNGTRLFMGEPDDAKAFAEFIGEMKAAFPVRRILLYGHSQGSFFVLYFVGEHPELVDGVVAHASGVWTWTKYNGKVARIPIVLMHGTQDPVVPYGQSIGGRDWYVEQGHRTVALRRLPMYNHWPNAVRASECLDWCIGMKTADPAEALAAALAMAAPKPADEYQYECPAWFAGAREVLRRFEGSGPRPFPEPALASAADAKSRAAALAAAIDAEGARQVASLRELLKPGSTLSLDGRPWLGHLVPLREDFRGVKPVEDYFKRLGYDALLKQHNDASGPLYNAWYGNDGPAAKFKAVTDTLPRCFLVEGLPAGLGKQMEDWMKRAKELDIPAEAMRRYAEVARWRNGWDEGLARYRELWSAWRLP
jgi:predicted esterase